MRLFIFRIFRIIFFPFILIVLTVIIWDPFKVFFTYEDYYTNNMITGNREHICLKLLKKREFEPTSFIIGNSRSLSFRTNYWATKISQNPSDCFHYDASGMGVYRVKNAIRFIDNQTTIKNVLLIIDTDFFQEISIPKGHLFIQPPEVSEIYELFYYWSFIKASFDPTFIFCNTLYELSGNYYDFMGYYIAKSKNSHIGINHTADFTFSFEKDIKNDSAAYYQNLIEKGVFERVHNVPTVSEKMINSKQLEFLNEVKEIIESNNAQIKIVISPLYNQLIFNKNDLQILMELFGENAVFDFSGKNEITSDFTNFYEASHYKPYVANEIMDFIYD